MKQRKNQWKTSLDALILFVRLLAAHSKLRFNNLLLRLVRSARDGIKIIEGNLPVRLVALFLGLTLPTFFVYQALSGSQKEQLSAFPVQYQVPDENRISTTFLDQGIEIFDPGGAELINPDGLIVENQSWGFIADDCSDTDKAGHGTHIAGILAQDYPSNIPLRITDQKIYCSVDVRNAAHIKFSFDSNPIGPGLSIMNSKTYSTCTSLSGTSMASTAVSGVVGMIQENHAEVTANEANLSARYTTTDLDAKEGTRVVAVSPKIWLQASLTLLLTCLLVCFLWWIVFSKNQLPKIADTSMIPIGICVKASGIIEARVQVKLARLDMALAKVEESLETSNARIRNEICHLQFQYNSLKQQERLGLVTVSEAAAQENRIAWSILELLTLLEKSARLPDSNCQLSLS